MNIGLELAVQNLGIGVPALILLVSTLGGFVFFAKDFTLGVLMQFFLSSGVFMLAWAMGWEFVIPLVAMLIWFVILSFTMYFVNKQTTSQGGFV